MPSITKGCFINWGFCSRHHPILLTLMHLLIVIGTRPNFIKVTRFRKVMDTIPGAKLTLVHTG